MRPRGEIREAVYDALVRLTAERGPVSSREVAQAACVSYHDARITIKNMRVAGEVRDAGVWKTAESRRWHRLFEPVMDDDVPVPKPWGGIEDLAAVMRAFRPSPVET
ncbi:MAG: hypothetical protein QM702_00060 [Rubrivivax sp.]